MENKRKGRGLLYIELMENIFWAVWFYFATVPTDVINSSGLVAGVYDTIMVFIIPAVLIGLPCGIIGVIQAVKYRKLIGWVHVPLFISSLLNSIIGIAIVIIIIIAFVLAPKM